MRAAIYRQHGGPEQLEVVETPDPEVTAGNVIVRVRAFALNGFDPMMLAGSTGLKVPLPMIPCGDFSGDIVSVGAEVDGWSVGDRVCGYPVLPGLGMMGEVTPGAACELVRMPAECLVRVPDSVSHEQAAALPVAYGTALRMVRTRGDIKAGERVLILGATGGVGVASLQLAKAAGACVVACGRGQKSQRLSAIGADDVIDTASGDFSTIAKARFGKPSYTGEGDGGFDVVINYIGGDTWAKGLRLVKRHGRTLVCGATAGYSPPTDLRYIWSFEQNVVGSNGWSVDDQQRLLAMVAGGELDPVIDSVRPITEIAESMTNLIERNVFGKAVLSV